MYRKYCTIIINYFRGISTANFRLRRVQNAEIYTLCRSRALQPHHASGEQRDYAEHAQTRHVLARKHRDGGHDLAAAAHR